MMGEGKLSWLNHENTFVQKQSCVPNTASVAPWCAKPSDAWVTFLTANPNFQWPIDNRAQGQRKAL